MIVIIDCGSQLTQNIGRRIREMGVFSRIVPYYSQLDEIFQGNPSGIIISGGQFSVYDADSPMYLKEVLHQGIPVLGICYGQQSIAQLLGGKVCSTEKREYGKIKVLLKEENPLFSGIPSQELEVWMSHGDVVECVPEGFKVLAVSENGHVASMFKDNIYAVQFHPEVDHTEQGRRILENFLTISCAPRTWDPEKEFDRIVKMTQEETRGRVGIGGISGGVDSTAACVLVSRSAGDSFTPVFVDNGLLRHNEASQVRSMLGDLSLGNLVFVDAADRFLQKLKNVVIPDRKRKVIGHEFIDVFEEEARKLRNVSYLVQGTLYTDVIESVPVYGCSSKIKLHHNVGGLPEKMGLSVVEPFRHLFKDEVRRIAEKNLGIPREIVHRHPFPGPGLAVRIIGEVTREKLDLLRQADRIFIEELHRRNLYDEISQAFAVLTGVSSVGVMGDEGNYQSIISLRAVQTKDFMTADWYDFKKEDLVSIANRIVNEVRGVNRVVYDITQKPPGTIEWE